MRAVLVSVVVLALVLAPAIGERGVPQEPPLLAHDDNIAVSRYDLRRTGTSPDAFEIPWESAWSFLTNGTSATAALAADVDGDGGMELFFGEMREDGADPDDRQGYVVDRHGLLRYAVPTYDDSYAAAAADLDGDGQSEFVFAAGSSGRPDRMGYRVFRGSDGSAAWNVTLRFSLGPPGQQVMASPALEDVDGDGLADLVAGSTDGSVYAFRGTDGSVLWRAPLSGPVVSGAPPIDDLDGDGRREVVVHAQDGVTHILDAASGAERWSFDAEGSPLALADFDGDGMLEIVTCGSGGLAAVRPNGTALWRWRTHSACGRTPVLVDVNGDGVPDIVGANPLAGRLAAFDGRDGRVIWDVEYAHVRGFEPLVASIMDEGRMFILVPRRTSSWAYLWLHIASSGSPKWIIGLSAGRFFYGEPLVRDLAGDGAAEMALAAGDGRLHLLGSQANVTNNRSPVANAGSAYVAEEGDTVTFSGAASTDPDGDNLSFRWDFDGDGTWDTAWSSDPTARYTWGDDWTGTARLEVSDGSLTDVDEATVAVGNAAPTATILGANVTVGDPRTVGYWGHQCAVDEANPHGEHTGIPQAWIDRIGAESRIFSGLATKDDVCAIVDGGDASNMAVMARRQLMGVWLNVVSGKVHAGTPLDLPSFTIAATVAEAIAEAEGVLLAAPERSELERVKDVADAINNGQGIALTVVELRAVASDSGSDDLTFAWDFGDGGTATATYYSDGVGPDPYPSPEVRPITATDVATHAYALAGTYTVTLTVTDDDGGSFVVSLTLTLG